jgi:hypothetical protein
MLTEIPVTLPPLGGLVVVVGRGGGEALLCEGRAGAVVDAGGGAALLTGAAVLTGGAGVDGLDVVDGGAGVDEVLMFVVVVLPAAVGGAMLVDETPVDVGVTVPAAARVWVVGEAWPP